MSLKYSPCLSLCISPTSGQWWNGEMYGEKVAFHFLMLFESLFLSFTNSRRRISVLDLCSLKIIPDTVKLGRWDVSLSRGFQQYWKHVHLGKLARLSHVGATGGAKRINWSPSYLFIWFLKYILWFWTLWAKNNENNNKKWTVYPPDKRNKNFLEVPEHNVAKLGII